MGTTPTYGFPYPEGSGLVIAGDDDIQALAEAVEAEITDLRTRSHITSDGGPAQGFSSAGGVVNFNAGTTSSDFEHDGAGTFTYGGGTQWFLAAVRVNIGASITGFRSTVVLKVAGVQISVSDIAGAAAGGTDYARHSHSLVVPMLLTAPQAIQVEASTSASPGSEVPVSFRSLRLVSLVSP